MEKSNFKISKKWILALTIFYVTYAGFSIIIMIAYSSMIIISAAIFYLFAIIYYFYRLKWLKKKDIDLKEICKLVPEETLEV